MINPFENVNGHRNETTCAYALTNIYPMENHPFKVKDDEDMEALVESIRQYGVLNPIIVRKRSSGSGYEIVSGHRRYEACKRLNKFDIPVIVRDLTDEEAILTMVDANLQRERILPSEKAFAYKMKMDVLRHQGSSCQDGTKRSDEALAEGTDDSARQIQRYIRLTYLIPELLELVDEEKIALCDIVSESNADFIKTSTGFSTHGATFDDVKLFADNIYGDLKIKAAGGISTLKDAEDFLNLGASRLGTSRIVKIVKHTGENDEQSENTSY